MASSTETISTDETTAGTEDASTLSSNESSSAANAWRNPCTFNEEVTKEELEAYSEHVQESYQQDKQAASSDSELFAVGDHVYQWCSLLGIPGMFQHHGIVVHSMDGKLTIADFSGMVSQSKNKQPQQPESQRERDNNNNNTNVEEQIAHPPPQKSLMFSSNSSTTVMREYTIDESTEGSRWRKVKYSAGLVRRTLSRSGTCTSAESDPPGLVLARVQFLLEHPNLLPHYHVLKSNCECVAVWCKTGTWATLQASSFLEVTAAGQVKSASTLALFAAHQTVTVPAAGVWGWMGFTTQVSLLSTQPLLIPVLVAYGLFSVGGPAWILWRCKHSWHETTTKLNDEFWTNAVNRPEVFVECITHWSAM